MSTLFRCFIVILVITVVLRSFTLLPHTRVQDTVVEEDRAKKIVFSEFIANASAAQCSQLPIWPIPQHCSATGLTAEPLLVSKLAFDFVVQNQDDRLALGQGVAALSSLLYPPAWKIAEESADRCKAESPVTVVLELRELFSSTDGTPFGALDVLAMEEAYELKIMPDEQKVHISGLGVNGVLNGIKSLAALLQRDKESGCRSLPRARTHIRDWPRFGHRGFLLDTAHHFVPIDFLKRTLLFLAAQKINVFHWHFTDHQRFGIKLNSHPKLATMSGAANKLVGPLEARGFFTQATEEGAAREIDYYTLQDVDELLVLGRALGVRVMPEVYIGHTRERERRRRRRREEGGGTENPQHCDRFVHPHMHSHSLLAHSSEQVDLPSHVAGWAGAYPEIVSSRCLDPEYQQRHRNAEPGKHCMSGNLNPMAARTMPILADILTEVAAEGKSGRLGSASKNSAGVFDDPLLHLGGRIYLLSLVLLPRFSD
jgi:hypothetical protein